MTKTVVIAGASGFLGAALSQRLHQNNGVVKRLVRRTPQSSDEIAWDPGRGTLDSTQLAGVDAIINLSGESIAQRWTPAARQRILDSRLQCTQLLVESLEALTPEQRPSVFISSSAVGIYGDRGDEELTEESPPGDGFLADVCRAWEKAAQPVKAAGVRLVLARTGVVLDPAGGALKSMLPIFRLGLGGKLGNGNQPMSWIARPDWVSLLLFCLNTESVAGPINFVAPQPVSNAEFTQILSRHLKRPGFFAVPNFAIRAALGQMGEEALLGSCRAVPQQALTAGFTFQTPDLPSALESVLG